MKFFSPFMHFISFMPNACYADNEGLPIGKLDLRRRVSIALGASKGK
jgi:hypothetical protein